MDKRKVILAYRRGFITMQECAQIMGIDSMRIMGMVNEHGKHDPPRALSRQSVNG